jgi:dGTPase
MSMMLARFAADPSFEKNISNHRHFSERESNYRSCYQRDYDRILHCSAFRRLKHKTQVFVEDEGDYFRTRLTHTLEVAQVARTISTALELNYDLSETIALAHDLGHTPFGHTGEEALDELMKEFGGFDHNAQALRIVTKLEQHYADFDGLNLTWDTLEGIAKHNGPIKEPIPYALSQYNSVQSLNLNSFASAEAQVAAISDDIAYNSHDLHDGLRANLFTDEDIKSLPLIDKCYDEVDRIYPNLDQYRRRHEALRRFFGILVEDVISQSKSIILEISPKSIEDIRNAGVPVIQFSRDKFLALKEIKTFLFNNMYRSPKVIEMRKIVTFKLQNLFTKYISDPSYLPADWKLKTDLEFNKTDLARLVADYISGMTDRYALAQHRKVFGKELP